MNVLIIGGSSNLGNSLIKMLSSYNVFVAGRNNADFYFNALDDILDNIYDGIPEVSESSVKKVYAPYEKYFHILYIKNY